jgi:hypothetical protein
MVGVVVDLVEEDGLPLVAEPEVIVVVVATEASFAAAATAEKSTPGFVSKQKVVAITSGQMHVAAPPMFWRSKQFTSSH